MLTNIEETNTVIQANTPEGYKFFKADSHVVHFQVDDGGSVNSLGPPSFEPGQMNPLVIGRDLPDSLTGTPDHHFRVGVGLGEVKTQLPCIIRHRVTPPQTKYLPSEWHIWILTGYSEQGRMRWKSIY